MTIYAKETGSSVTVKNEQFGFDIFVNDPNISVNSEKYYCDGAGVLINEQFGYDIFSDDPNIDADSVAYYCDGADAAWP